MSSTLAQVSKLDNGSEVVVDVNGTLSVDLDENPTTGYKWCELDFDKEHLELVEDKYVPTDSVTIGGGGVHHFRFFVRTNGRSKIQIAYKRPWERQSTPASIFSISVRSSK